MRTFGETLRQARLDKGVSIADAERDTRIRRRYLEALESEDAGTLPPPVYTRGFVRTYAEYLGLNAQAMVDLYQPTTRREPTPTLRPAIPRLAIPRELPIRPILWGIGAMILVAALVFLWNQYQDAARVVREQEGISGAPRGTATVPARVPTPNPIAFASPSPTVPPTPTAPPPTPSPTPVLDGILVEFRTKAPVYVEAFVDGKEVFAETLQGATQRTLPLAKDVVLLRVSNGSALEITMNGKQQDPVSGQGPMELTWRR